MEFNSAKLIYFSPTGTTRKVIEASACIHCTACVKICPTGARVWEDSWIKNIAEWLSTNCSKRKEPEIYL